MTRTELLHAYGQFYGEQHFAVAFTSTTHGDDAKRVITRGWDKTMPLPDGPFGSALLAGRGDSRNPVIVLRPSNLIVLECDTEDDLLRIEDLQLPVTITVRSSKPYKRHYYFRPAVELEALPYVAFRFESGKLTADTGRYFLAPPSIHPSGAVYAFLPGRGPGNVDLATLPEHVYRNLAQQARLETSELRDALGDDPETKIQAGNRRDLIFRYACMLRRWGIPRAQILEQCHHFNETRCDPPVDRQLVAVQVDGAMKKSGNQEILAGAPQNGSNPHENNEERDSWQPINLNNLPEQPPVQPTLGSVGLVYPGKRHVFSGPQESAKTLAAYTIGLQVVREGGTLILIDFEMGAWDARNRLLELGAQPQDLDRIHYLEPSDPATENTMPALLNLKPDLVIVDAAAGAYDLQGLDDNKRQDVERFTRLYVRAFWKANVATIVLDHVVKNTETRGKYAVGSERKVGGADVHLGFEVVIPISRGSTGLYKIVTHKDRGGFLKRGTLANMHLESHPDTHQIQWEFKSETTTEDSGDDFRPTRLMEKVSAYLERHPDGITRNKIEQDVIGRAGFIRKAVDALITDGYATEEPGVRGKLVNHLTRYDQKTAGTNQESGSTMRADGVSLYTNKTTTPQSHGVTHDLQEQSPLQTDSLHGRPTPSHPVPDGVHSPRPTPSPSTEGTGRGDTATDEVTPSRWAELFDDTQPEEDPNQ